MVWVHILSWLKTQTHKLTQDKGACLKTSAVNKIIKQIMGLSAYHRGKKNPCVLARDRSETGLRTSLWSAMKIIWKMGPPYHAKRQSLYTGCCMWRRTCRVCEAINDDHDHGTCFQPTDSYLLCCSHTGHSECVTNSYTFITQLESLYLQCHSYKYLTQVHKTFLKTSLFDPWATLFILIKPNKYGF